MLDEVGQPYLEDLERRARIGAIQAAPEIGFGVLTGLYAPAVMRTTTTGSSPMRERLLPSTTLVRKRTWAVSDTGNRIDEFSVRRQG